MVSSLLHGAGALPHFGIPRASGKLPLGALNFVVGLVSYGLPCVVFQTSNCR